MEFKSQMCTSREQSERLLALGLKRKTADCALLPLTDKVTSVLVKPSTKDIKNTIPAWSLHRLIELIEYDANADAIKELLSAETMFGNNLYTAFINIIEYLISNNKFNPDYLEDKQ